MPIIDDGQLKTHYSLTGDEGKILAFSNSLGTDFSMWDAQVPALQDRFRILRYDTRGHGKSSVTPGDYSIDQLGRDFLNLLDSLHLDRVDFCGLSMGGMIGIWLGIHAPQRLRRLILCNTAPQIGNKETWNARIATVRKEGMKPVAAAVVERWFTPEFRESCRKEVERTRQMLEKSPPEGYAACCAAVRDMDQREAVARIQTPTLVIYGGKDPVIPIAEAQSLTAKIAGAAKVELAAAHLSNIEQPEPFTRAVSEFLS